MTLPKGKHVARMVAEVPSVEHRGRRPRCLATPGTQLDGVKPFSWLRCCSNMELEDVMLMENSVLYRMMEYMEQNSAQQAHSATMAAFNAELGAMPPTHFPAW